MKKASLPVLMACAAWAAAAPAKAPVYIYLFSRMDDHINLERTEEHLRRTLPMLERQRERHPRYGVAISCRFSGTVSHLLAERNRAHQLVDRINESVRRGVAEIGYDGSEEPTILTRPQPNFRRARTPQDRWLARAEAAEWFLTEFKHFLTGEPDPSRPGGLAKTQEVFGEAAFVGGVSRELGSDSEIVHQLRRLNRNAMMPGIPEPHTYPARNLHGFGGAVEGMAGLVSPAPDCPPELYWQDHVLRLSDTSGPAVKVVNGHGGPEALKKMLEALDRSRIHVIQVRLGRPGMFLRPEFEKANPSPLQYAYDHPKMARAPSEANRPEAEIEAAFAQEETLVRWLAEDFFPANPGSRFVTSGDLMRLAATSLGSAVPKAALTRAADDLLARWKIVGNHPPAYALAEGEYFSLGDMFQLLASALAEFHRRGALPESVRPRRVYGPLEAPDDQGPSLGKVSVASVARACAELSRALNEETWKPVPENVIPAWITVDGIRLNAAQFLRLMAEGFTTGSPGASLEVRTCQMFHEPALILPSSRPQVEGGAAWTIKPARLRRPDTPSPAAQ